jgi:UDP-glucuronate decarboxylase
VNPIGPRSCYDEGKRVAESLLLNYQQQNHVDIRIVRIFNTYGPRMALNDGRVISNFILQALRGEPITIFGRGEQTRSFCYVSDLIAGIMQLMEQSYFCGPVNLGNPKEITILELAELILKLTASKSKLIFKELPVDDPVRRCPDISLAREKFGWEIKVQLQDGLRETIGYFRKVLPA